METASEHAETLVHTPPPPSLEAPRTAVRRSRDRAGAALRKARFAIGVYLGTRALLLLVAFVNGTLRHHAFTHELSQWDGLWYRMLADHGYPTHVMHVQSTLGFFPLYPLVVWAVSHAFVAPIAHYRILSTTIAGVIVSGIGGVITTVLVQRLAAGWWGERTGRKAVLIFCLFPGSVVFSMVYAEGVMLALVAGCILALQKRRWVLAGALAAFATATEPEAIVLVVVCVVSALLELRRRGLTNPEALKSLVAPALSVVGVGAFGAFLWIWTGSPFASLIAQRDGWSEKTNVFALGDLANALRREVSFSHFNHPTINLNLVVGLIGAVALIVMLVLVVRNYREMSAEAIVWTFGISWLALTSEYTPPMPRLVITAFPAVIVLARYVHGKWWTALLWFNGVLLVVLSALTFVGTTLRP
ncbi:MAG TPA: mannosyltransferase family protein [Solirubrobacteraceae bacterium]|nr:mannosyltransferase family protein [Solirubrobacteraceae bacterium]